MPDELTQNLLHFISRCPTAFHAAAAMKKALVYSGFEELPEENPWTVQWGGRYVVTRNGSALIALTLPAQPAGAFRLAAAHGDSPALKIKENPELCDAYYIRLNVEGYGGLICSTWTDRPLSVAGRVMTEENGKITSRLVCVDRDLLVIPSLAIHMNRSVNESCSWNIQKDLLPLYGEAEDRGAFMKLIAREAGLDDPSRILGHDLFLYSRIPGTVWGARSEFLSSPRLDDLQCAFAAFRGFTEGKKEKYICVNCLFDNEETGSHTRQGAASDFLESTLRRITEGLGLTYDQYKSMLARSFMLSADNAHGVHPNYEDLSDPVNRPVLNGGVVLKFNAAQKYCTDAVSAALFRHLCQRAHVSCQSFANRSDMAGGSTLGNLSAVRVPVPTADIGLPQLAMHSSWETAGVRDTADLVNVCSLLFE